MASPAVQKPDKEYFKIVGPAVLVTLIGFIAAYQFVDPAPPERITIATGSADGAYYLFGQKYREILARNDIELVVKATAGSVENLKLLGAESGGVEVAFVQGGTSALGTSGDRVALGSLYFEPLWVFLRANTPGKDLAGLRGMRLAVGAEGSGTRAVAMQLLADNAVNEENATLLPLGGGKATSALLKGEVDAVFLVASPESPTVKTLLQNRDVTLMTFERAAAYTRIHRFLSSVILPQGVLDMSANMPPRDVVLLAPTASLVASPSLHPALVDLLLQAAAEVHGPGGMFEKRGEFPSPDYVEFPLSPVAKRFYKSGPPFLQRYLPFWAATLIDRMMVMLLPLVALAIPLLRLTPPVFRWRIRSRIYRWYRELLAIDPALSGNASAEQLNRNLQALDRMEADVSKVEVPMSYADQLYHLRLHIELVREKLEQAIAGKQTP